MKILLLVSVLLFASACRTTGDREESSARDVGTYKGYSVYVWPESNDSPERDYESLATQMGQYAELVGVSLEPALPNGTAECRWRQDERSDRVRRVEKARGDTTRFCGAVASCYLKKGPLGPSNDRSEYCQYGNCGEGALVGACLALHYGFGESEILVCQSTSDHAFSLVPDPKGTSWCILDRFSQIGNFRCGISFAKNGRDILVDGEDAPSVWYDDARCRTLRELMTTPFLWE